MLFIREIEIQGNGLSGRMNSIKWPKTRVVRIELMVRLGNTWFNKNNIDLSIK